MFVYSSLILSLSLSVIDRLDTKMFPSVVDPMLSVGTYTPTTLGDSQGYSVIFDNLGKGQVYSATGSDQATLNNTIPVLILSNPGSVNMNGIVLSSDAVSVTMGDTGYILDKVRQRYVCYCNVAQRNEF